MIAIYTRLVRKVILIFQEWQFNSFGENTKYFLVTAMDYKYT